MNTTTESANTTTATTVVPDINIDCDGWKAIYFLEILGPMLGITLALTFLKERKKLWPEALWKRPGILYPINFIDTNDRRWAYAAVFGALSYEVLKLFLGEMYYSTDLTNNDNWHWLNVFIITLNILILTGIFYPLPVCLQYNKYLFINILGILITLFFFGLTLYSNYLCSVFRKDDLGIGLITQVLNIPVYICYIILVVCFTSDALTNIKRIYSQRRGIEQAVEVKKSGNIIYMEALLKRRTQGGATSIQEGLVRIGYQTIEGFTYSPRVVCTMVVALFVLYKSATSVGYSIDEGMTILIAWVRGLYENSTTEVVGNSTLEEAVEFLLITRYSFMFSNAFAGILQVIFIVHMILTYRSHFRRLLKGDHTWHHEITNSPTSLLLNGMKYSGYQIAYIIYGYVIIMLIVVIFAMIFSFLLVQPLMYNRPSPLVNLIKRYWSTVLITAAIYAGQYAMARFAFLQDHGKYLALNNRRVYHVMCFVLFFFNILVGLFACLKRILISMVLGTIMLARLDHCLLMRGFERLDGGYQAYIGMLMVDIYHNHPLLKAAIEILQDRIKTTTVRASTLARAIHEDDILILDDSSHVHQDDDPGCSSTEDGAIIEFEVCMDRTHNVPAAQLNYKKLLRRKRIQNKWWKLVTLANNPQLILDRAYGHLKELQDSSEHRTARPKFGFMEVQDGATVEL